MKKSKIAVIGNSGFVGRHLGSGFTPSGEPANLFLGEPSEKQNGAKEAKQFDRRDSPAVREMAAKLYKKGLNPQTIRNTLKAMYNL